MLIWQQFMAIFSRISVPFSLTLPLNQGIIQAHTYRKLVPLTPGLGETRKGSCLFSRTCWHLKFGISSIKVRRIGKIFSHSKLLFTIVSDHGNKSKLKESFCSTHCLTAWITTKLVTYYIQKTEHLINLIFFYWHPYFG